MGGGGREGRSYRSRTQRKHFKQSRENVWKRSKSDPDSTDGHASPWQPFATQNPSFDEYYKEQGIVAAEEWDRFIEVLRKPLPAAFRINSSSQFCSDIRSQLENDFMKSLQTEVIEEGEVEPIRPLPWYPNNLAWHSNFSRMQLRKNQTLERFHKFLKLENEIGNITRQEAVSMVPPLFLDVQPDHFVLDMCAAPGSKTFQLLEIIHQSTNPGALPNGMVIANDLDVQRCNLLIHQTKRMCTANLIVTNHEAQHFPGCRANKNFSSASDKGIESESNMGQLLFDRVLCDVPCSGDGTLARLQISGENGISLLKVGGRIVYSTCSMNPVENEAVVAEILRKCEGSVELVDVSNEVPQLIHRPGLRKWKVRDKGIWLASHKHVRKFRRIGIVPSMFPSGSSHMDATDIEPKHGNVTDVNSDEGLQQVEDVLTSADDLEEEVSDLPLERCMRLVPHDQNSGAFFIAVLQKVSPLPVVQEKHINPEEKMPPRNDDPPKKLQNQDTEEVNGMEVDLADGTDEKDPEGSLEANSIDNEDGAAVEPDPLTCEKVNSEETEVPVNTETKSERTGGKRKLQIQGKWKGIDPVIFFNDETIINSIKTFYGIDDSFQLSGHLVSRNSDTNRVKRIYYVSKSVKDALDLNFRVGQQLKITSVGLKMFERQTSREGNSAPCSFRISSEGLPVILPYITKQILYASLVDFKHLLQYKTIKFADFVDAEFGEKASKLMMGCCVIVLSKGGEALSNPIQIDASTIAIGCWKGRASLSVMVTAIDCQELLERLLMRLEIEKGDLVQENALGTDEVQEEMNDNGKEEPESLEVAVNT